MLHEFIPVYLLILIWWKKKVLLRYKINILHTLSNSATSGLSHNKSKITALECMI